MKRTWWMGLLAGVAGTVVLTSFTSLEAQNRGGTGGAVCIDVVKIFDEYNRQKDLTEEMRRIQEDMRNEIEQREKRMETLQATIDAMDPSEPTITKRMRELLQLQIDFKNWSDTVIHYSTGSGRANRFADEFVDSMTGLMRYRIDKRSPDARARWSSIYVLTATV